jgi:Resolvase, N terminal domain
MHSITPTDAPDDDPLAGSRLWTSPGMASESHRWWMNELLVVYACVSTEQQDLTSQRNGLHALGVGDDRIYVGHGLTGTNRDRPGLRRGASAGPRAGGPSGAARAIGDQHDAGLLRLPRRDRRVPERSARPSARHAERWTRRSVGAVLARSVSGR